MKIIKSIKRILVQLNYILTKKQKREAFWVFVALLLGVFCETLGVSAIVPYMQVILSPENLQGNRYVNFVLNLFDIDDKESMILWMTGMLILVYVLKNVYLAVSTYIQLRFAAKVQREMAVNMMKTYMKRPYGFYLDVNTSELYQTISVDTNSIYIIIEQGFRLLADMITICAIIVFIVIADFMTAISVVFMTTACFWFIWLLYKDKIRSEGLKFREYNTLVIQHTYQAFMGIKEVLVMHRQDFFASEYEKKFKKKSETQVTQTFSTRLPNNLIEAVCVSGLLFLVCFKVRLGIDVATFMPQLAALAVAAFRILPAISKMTSAINQIMFYEPSLSAVYNNTIEIENYELQKKDIVIDNVKCTGKQLSGFEKILSLNNVHFKYDNTDKEVISGVDLKICKNTSVAFVGASGAGKTTLVDMILGLLKPQEGMIAIDGMDIFENPEKWAKIIGYVPQTVYMIDDTIRNNIAFGVATEDIDDAKIWSALEQAQLKTFVEELPNGLDNVVGERGVRISGGQRQRLAIARALYHEPDILVLDEATSALDNDTEEAVMQAIETLQGKKTLIIVAHRLSTIKNCDVIYEIADGKAIRRNKEEIIT